MFEHNSSINLIFFNMNYNYNFFFKLNINIVFSNKLLKFIQYLKKKYVNYFDY